MHGPLPDDDIVSFPVCSRFIKEILSIKSIFSPIYFVVILALTEPECFAAASKLVTFEGIK